MISTEYANAYTEILEIIKYIPDSYYKKIPSKYIQVFQKNSNNNYCFKYTPQKSLDEQNVSKTTKGIIALLYRDFWANDETKKKIVQYQENKKFQIEKAKNEAFDPSSMFEQSATINQISQETPINTTSAMITYKESIFKKILNKIKSIFDK